MPVIRRLRTELFGQDLGEGALHLGVARDVYTVRLFRSLRGCVPQAPPKKSPIGANGGIGLS